MFDKIVATLLDATVNLFDTAAMYADAEDKLGIALEGKRDNAVLVSKCGTKDKALPGEEWSAELITASIDRSLRGVANAAVLITRRRCPAT